MTFFLVICGVLCIVNKLIKMTELEFLEKYFTNFVKNENSSLMMRKIENSEGLVSW